MDFKNFVVTFALCSLVAVTTAAQDVVQDAKTHGVRLRWEFVDGAAKYHVQVATEPTFAKSLIDIDADELFAEWKPTKNGHFYWRVQAIDPEGEKGLYT